MPGGCRTEKPAYKQDGGTKLYKVEQSRSAAVLFVVILITF